MGRLIDLSLHRTGEMAEDSSTRTWSISSRGSTVSSSCSDDIVSSELSSLATRDVQQQEEEEEVVGVAVGKEVKECKANLLWVLSNMDAILLGSKSKKKKKAKVLLLHVHRPAKNIPFMGANFPADQLHESEVSAFRQAEAEAMNRAMAKYRVLCARVKVPAVCKVDEKDDDVAKGILRLVAQNGITRLVIGAAADKRYNRKLTAPTSKTALSVQQQVPPTCSIWFICKGNLVCSRPSSSSSISFSYQQPMSYHHQQQQQQQQQLPSVAAAGSGAEYYNIQQTTIFAKDDEADQKPINNRREKTTMNDHQAAESRRQEAQAAEELQLIISSQQRVINDLQAKLSEAHCVVFSLERDLDDLRRQRDAAFREVAALGDRVRRQLLEDFTELSFQDLQEALADAMRLGGQKQLAGGGGYGSVYKAVLRRLDDESVVAIKVLNHHPEGIISSNLLVQQVEELRKLRHPNLVPLLGACLLAEEPKALVYEFIPPGGREGGGGGGGGSCLEDRLPSLPWADRTRIAAHIHSALVFLHQNNMVHGDLKPTNVLLLHDGTTKLADYGLCRLLQPEQVMLRCTSLPHMDPEFLASGELRPSSDVYAFGVLLLQLLTRRPAMGLVRQVRLALADRKLPGIIMDALVDPQEAEQASQLAHLAVRCCEMASTDRPDLAGEMVTRTLERYLHQ